jgi:hypothetical protein
MCDALSWNTSKLSEGVEVMIAHCLAHGRRQIVDVAENFPAECRYVLEQLGEVNRTDAMARKTGLTPEERLQFHQEHSKPIIGFTYVAGGATGRTQDGTELGIGASDSLSAAALIGNRPAFADRASVRRILRVKS